MRRIPLFIIILLRKIRHSGVYQIVLGILTLLLLYGTVSTYRAQEKMMREVIFSVVGEDRNTSAKLLLNKDTTRISPSHGCQFSGKNSLAIVMIPTLPGARQRRDLIRTSWAVNRFDTQIMVFFFSGLPDDGDLRALEEESSIHGDLIVEDLSENYYALAIKTLRMLKWFDRNCPKAEFFIKADDDVFLNLPTFAKALQALPSEFEIGGRVLEGRTPNLLNPFSKWYTPAEMWPEGTIAPSYLGGPCYVIRGSFVPQLLSTSPVVPLYHLEDVFLTGMVASQKLGVQLYEFPGTLDPKYPKISYWLQKYFSFEDSAASLTSFHTDGVLSLMKSFHYDFESSRAIQNYNHDALV